jgi:hypothetical protein
VAAPAKKLAICVIPLEGNDNSAKLFPLLRPSLSIKVNCQILWDVAGNCLFMNSSTAYFSTRSLNTVTVMVASDANFRPVDCKVVAHLCGL